MKSFKVKMPKAAKVPRLTPKVKIYGRRKPQTYVPKHMQGKVYDPFLSKRRRRKKSWLEKLLDL